jgi:hypothetical protein
VSGCPESLERSMRMTNSKAFLTAGIGVVSCELFWVLSSVSVADTSYHGCFDSVALYYRTRGRDGSMSATSRSTTLDFRPRRSPTGSGSTRCSRSAERTSPSDCRPERGRRGWREAAFTGT